jgi:hypothetical protein
MGQIGGLATLHDRAAAEAVVAGPCRSRQKAQGQQARPCQSRHLPASFPGWRPESRSHRPVATLGTARQGVSRCLPRKQRAICPPVSPPLGGKEEAIVFFSIRAGTEDALYELLDDDQQPIGLIGFDTLIALFDAQKLALAA